MKKIKLIFTVILLSNVSLALDSSIHKQAIKGTSIGEYLKPGAPVQIAYTSEHVNTNEVSKVDIILTSSATTGTMKVKVHIDKALDEETKIGKKIYFDIDPAKKEYLLSLSVSSQSEGLHYIKLQIEIQGKGMRAFAIPVHIGDTKSNQTKKILEKNTHGENLSISDAVETIK